MKCIRQRGGQLRVLVAGDSHAGQWMLSLDQVAKSRNWTLEMATKSSCPLIDIDLLFFGGGNYTECRAWNAAMMELLTGPDRPQVLMVSHSNYLQFVSSGGTMKQRQKALVDAEIATLRRIQAAGVEVVLLRDTPQFKNPVPQCVLGNPRELANCAVPRAEAEERRDQGQPDVASALGLQVADLTDAVCPGTTCPAVIGGVLLWRDTNHLTATYAATAGELADQLLPALG